MDSHKEKYEAVIGLEVHAQLSTKTKAYCSDSTLYGASPNSQTSPISLGHPGTLPKSNKKVIDYAIKMGIACGSKIRNRNEYSRKNYFYADLPKGYQITQDKTPICNGGKINIKNKIGEIKEIGITRIHMEEDAGKSIHDQDPFNTLIDLNRAGVGLIEIVSEPELRSSDEAYNFLIEIRKLVRYLEICDGNLEEGSLRCDANISVMLKGSKKFGDRVEVKNMNSLRNVKTAIEYEINRQIELIERGEKVEQQTRSFNAANGDTVLMRKKEEANDYRYFPEPDLQPIIITSEYIEKIKKNLPPLPNDLFKKFNSEFKLSEYDSNVLIEDKNIALYFDNLCNYTKNFKAASNFVTVTIKSYLNENALNIINFPIKPKRIGELINLVDDGKISTSIAKKNIFEILLKNDDNPQNIAEENNWIKESNDSTLQDWVNQAISKFPDKVNEYKKGKKGLIGLFMGEVMKLSKGKADPKAANLKIKKTLENN